MEKKIHVSLKGELTDIVAQKSHACEQSYAFRMNQSTRKNKQMCVHAFYRQKIEDLEAERQRLEEQNNILEMRLERHNLQVGTKTSYQLFSVMNLLIWHKGTNLPTQREAD